ncbi:MAG: hypothetical protein J1E04_04455 [Alistipes sp.]|nr:hypothetical protein [Alistipes sp.]
MRHNIRFNIFGLFAAAVSLLTVACQQDPLDEAGADNSEYVAVTFSIQPESLPGVARATRAAGNVSGKVNYSESHISDGTKADVLVYAVYDAEGNLLPEFGQVERGEDSCLLPDGTELGAGQTYEEVTTFPKKITLTVRRGKTYKIAFWAQNSTCKAYDIHDLTKVQIHYTEIDSVTDADDINASSTPNNDEMRDAFCKVEELSITSKSINNRVIYLYRPLAQVNVGTTGYDYETIVQDAEMNYAYTRIQIASAPRYLNVVEDRIETEKTKDNYSALEYGWALIPAYANSTWAESHPDHNWAVSDAALFSDIATGSIFAENLQRTYEWEEFLRVKIYDDDKDNYLPYAGLDKNNEETETFKYLSMCYVLAASNRNPESNAYDRSVFDRVRVWIATDKMGANEKQIVDIVDVPATRNWRTNIVGNILTTDVAFEIKLDPIYAGDYNGFYEDTEVSWSGPLNGLDGGVFYDAENDEILISNVNGLLWFQQMVNGDLLYRDDINRTIVGESVKKKTPIKYYDEDGTEHSFGDSDAPYYFKGIPDPTKGLEEGTPEYEEALALKNRILRATHQDTNVGHNPGKGQTWPEFNNFHFVGQNESGNPDPANVKLVADIDLSGIEWLSIGFDCKMEQTLEMLGENGSNNKNSNETHTDKKTHRGFFGHFDGNGHTVSNLTTKRFSINVHPASLQIGAGGPFEAVQWCARGFFGQIGGTATVENLTLSNVNIYGNNCVGGIAGAAIGVKGKDSKEGTEINIRNCVVDGGKIENVPMFRGDAAKTASGKQNRTYARGVNTGGIVGLYNASGSVTDCEVRNLNIDGYRTTGGIVGCISNYYLAYTSEDWQNSSKINTDSKVKMKSITGNKIFNTTILSDHFKPFDVMQLGKFDKNGYTADWVYGFSWIVSYSSYVHNLVGGEFGGDSLEESPGMKNYVEKVSDNSLSGSQIIDFACDIVADSNNVMSGRVVDIDNAPVDVLPVLNNWFADYVNIRSNLVGNATSYKRYGTYRAEMFTSTGVYKQVMWNLPNDYEINWDKESGAVGMRVGAVELDGHDYILSVRGVTGENDCAVQISSCDRSQFSSPDMPADWDKSAETTLKNLTVRGNPYAYTGICLSPNECMKSITLEDISVYDVYRTIALDNLEEKTGNVWPKKIAPESVTLTVRHSNLRGYTAPGAGWQSVTYTNVIFETGANVGSSDDDASKRSTCDVEAVTLFDGCTFKAPFTIEIKGNVDVTFTGCKVDGPNTPEIESEALPEGTKKIEINANGEITYYDVAGSVLTVEE